MKKTEIKTNISEIKDRIGTWFGKNKPLAMSLIIAMVAFLIGYFIRNSLIVATVNGKPIWRYKVVKQLENFYGANILNSLVEQELIKQEAEDKKIKVSDEEVSAQIKEIEATMISQGQTLDQALKESNMTRKDLEDSYRLNLTVEKILAGSVEVTDEEVQKYIDDNKDSFPEGTEMETVKTIIIGQLKQEKMSTQYQTFMKELRQKAEIKTVAKY